MKKGLPKWAIIGLSLVVVGGLGYLAYQKLFKKDNETPPQPASDTNSQGQKVESQSTKQPVSQNTGITGGIAKPQSVVVTKRGTALFSSDLSKVIRKTTADNELVGPFVRYGTIKGQTYIMFADKYNQNVPTLVNKAFATLK